MELYGVRGWGSAITELMLALAGEPCRFVDVDGFDREGRARVLLAGINPLIQVPALVLDDGTVMTETAAIALWLVDRHPRLAPTPGTASHAAFIRLLIWIVANVYPTFTYGDYPERWAPGAAAELVSSTDAHREALYLWLEERIVGRYALGGEVSVLDCYLAVMIDWRPRRDWFSRNAPRILHAAEATRRLPALKAAAGANGLF